MEDKARYNKEEKESEKDSGFLTFICNRRTGEFCGRTAGSWAKILIFYVIFYACLAAFWALMLLIFYQTIDENKPKWTLDQSRIGTNPGLGYRPRPPKAKVESTLIWFKSGNNVTYKHILDDLNGYIKNAQLTNITDSQHVTSDCQTNEPRLDSEAFCQFNYDSVMTGSDCNAGNDFGYREGKPCVLIKLNRIFDWYPINYAKGKKPEGVNVDDGFIHIKCEGENPADKENMAEVKYFPEKGISFKYFPFRNKPGYISPFVWVQFMSVTPGILLNIECKAYAGNIVHNRADREGTVHFELLVD